jgi:outer membrane immunogenic protein
MKTSVRSAFRCLAFTAAVVVTAAFFMPPATAADMPVKSGIAPSAGYSWTGFYFGVHGGYGWGSTRLDEGQFTSPTFSQTDTKLDGALAGGQLGANWQYGNLVVGAELDGSWASIRNSVNSNTGIIGFPGQKFDVHALATATGRVGYAMGPWLAYAKAGGAWADIKLTTGSLGVVPVSYSGRSCATSPPSSNTTSCTSARSRSVSPVRIGPPASTTCSIW